MSPPPWTTPAQLDFLHGKWVDFAEAQKNKTLSQFFTTIQGEFFAYAYVVKETKFAAYLQDFQDKIPDDKSTCNNHDAIKAASMRGGLGTAASGVGTGGECSWHDMKRPTAIGDLQKGERYVFCPLPSRIADFLSYLCRYVNMDYFFLSNIRHHTPRRVVISYDINCQWSRNLFARCAQYNDVISLPPNIDFTFLVPKIHLYAHRYQCQTTFSFNFEPHVGRTDGESPERGWSDSNAIATSTKEMGPGSRRDTMDDFFGDYNWRKVMAFGRYLTISVSI